MTQTTTAVGPVPTGERALAPDLARGVMLALIALANSVVYLYGRPYGVRQHIVEHGVLDRVVSVLALAPVGRRSVDSLALRGNPRSASTARSSFVLIRGTCRRRPHRHLLL